MSRVLRTGNNQITRHYGQRHTGVDVVKYSGQLDDIIAHSSGKVVFCQKGQNNNPGSTGNASYGNCVKIKHNNGMYTLYAHLESVDVSINQVVAKGQKIGRMGNTGNSYGAHLHFEVFNKNNVRVNPEKYLNNDLDGSVTCTGVITYQVYANNKWYEEVRKADNTPQGYAGNGRNAISGLRAKPQFGEITIQTYTDKSGWLGEISSRNYKANDKQNGNSYSGVYGEPIKRIRIKCTCGFVDFRILTSKGWGNWVRGTNVFGEIASNEPILGVQMI